MAIAFSPDPLAFGNVAVGSTLTLTLTITNDVAETTIAAAASGDFTYAGCTVIVGTTTMEVTFSPTSATSYASTIVTAAGDSVAVTGTGTQAVTAADDGDYYTDGSYTSGSTDYKSLLLEVPNFNGAASSETVGGGTPANYTVSGGLTSYLRLGAVPSDVQGYYASTPTKTFAQIGAENSGEDLAELVKSFSDDNRDRGTAGTDPNVRMIKSARSTETAKLHTRGGWRDHTDGNRITTTRGDKVEVIGGHYKQVVLGRRQWKQDIVGMDGSMHFESSGGISYHFDQVPGQIVDVTWVPVTAASGGEQGTAATFRIKEECQKGHTVARYDGEFREWKYGPKIVERVASRAAYTAITKDNVAEPSAMTYAAYGSDSDLDQDNSEELDIGTWPPSPQTAPDVTETTWARTITEHEWAVYIAEYTGSSDQKVKKIIEETYAAEIYEYDEAGTVKDIEEVSGTHTTSIKAHGSSKIVEKRRGRYSGGFDGNCGEFWGLSLSDGNYHFTNFGEAFAGGFESYRLGLSATCFAGLQVDFHLLAIGIDVYLASILAEFVVVTQRYDFYPPPSADVKIGLLDTEGALAKKMTTLQESIGSVVKTIGPPMGYIAAYLTPFAMLAIIIAATPDD